MSVLPCVVLICKGDIVVMGVCLNMKVVGDIYLLGQGTTGNSGGVV